MKSTIRGHLKNYLKKRKNRYFRLDMYRARLAQAQLDSSSIRLGFGLDQTRVWARSDSGSGSTRLGFGLGLGLGLGLDQTRIRARSDSGSGSGSTRLGFGLGLDQTRIWAWSSLGSVRSELGQTRARSGSVKLRLGLGLGTCLFQTNEKYIFRDQMASRPISVRNDRRPISLQSQSNSVPEIVHFKVSDFVFELLMENVFRGKILFYFNWIYLVEQLVIMKVQWFHQ
jgi:hypothetical protein